MYVLTCCLSTVAYSGHADRQGYLTDGSRPNGPNFQFVGGHSAVAALMGNFMWVVAIGGWLITIASLVVVANRVNVAPETLRFGRTVSALTSVIAHADVPRVFVWAWPFELQNRESHVAGAIVQRITTRRVAPYGVRLGICVRCVDSGRDNCTSVVRIIYSQRLWDT